MLFHLDYNYHLDINVIILLMPVAKHISVLDWLMSLHTLEAANFAYETFSLEMFLLQHFFVFLL